MTPISGPDRAILDLLEAGRTFDDVCEIGRNRKAWPPSAVHRVVSQWVPERRPARLKPIDVPPKVVKERRLKPPRKPIVHGKPAGYRAHLREGTDPCTPCRTARNADDQRRKAEKLRACREAHNVAQRERREQRKRTA